MKESPITTILLLICAIVAAGYYVTKDALRQNTGVEAVTPAEFSPDPSVSTTEIPLPADDKEVFDYLDSPMTYADNPQVPALAVGNHGYLQFDMQCRPEGLTSNNGPEQIKCLTLDNGAIIDLQFLTLLPPVLNADLLRPDFECTMLCIDAEGYPVGRAQFDMFKWREEHCRRDTESGVWTCKAEK